jgi:DNA repair exonuclease SbcCD nuclease subunit
VKNKKIIALSISDIHIHKWKSHNEGMKRTKDTMKILQYVSNKAEELSVPVLCPGDLFHGEVGPILLSFVEDHWPSYFRENFFAISGNHDQEEKSFVDSQQPSMVTYFHKKGLLQCLDFEYRVLPDFFTYGIPYLTYNKGLLQAIENLAVSTSDNYYKILMIHTDLYGAKESDGREVGTVEGLPRDMGKLFEPFDLVLCGHIHKPQEIIPGKVIMVGAPQQQRKSDADGEFGYWEIYSDFSYKFVPLDWPSKFMFYNEGDIPGDDYNYWIMNRAEGVGVVDEDTLEFSSKSSTTHLAKAFLTATGEKRYSYKKALINTLKEADDDTF